MRQLVALDDDPTGAQALTDVPVLLEWDAASIRRAASVDVPAIHLITNTRAYSPERAHEVVSSGASAASAALPEARLLLRGDSTLRGHVFEEYLAVRDAVYPGQDPVLLLVPALPAAGRITVDGVHMLERDGSRRPLHETEYATDPAFSYADSRLLQWAEDRSHGHFPRANGAEIPLDSLRNEGPEVVASVLAELDAAAGPAACAPDAETIADLHIIAEGLELAESRGATIIVRSAPTFVGVLAGNLATEYIATPVVSERVLVLCGSYVPMTTRQLARLLTAHPESSIEVDLRALASANPDAEIGRAARDAERAMRERRVAIVATPRKHLDLGLAAGERIAVNLARILARLDPLPEVVVAKGGITAAVTVREGLGATEAWVEGPIVDGVSLWRVTTSDGRTVPYVVFPGNVGENETLAEIVDLMLGT